ncbi:TraU family protein (plasmid) [Escherichia coli]
MPLDVLFWCAGSQGSMYPFNGWVSNESSPLQSSLLVSERMAFKLHRQGMIMETIGKKITPSVMNIRPQSCPKNAGVIRW